MLQEIKTCAKYFCLLEPTKTDPDGLIECLGRALKFMGIENLLARDNVLGVHELPIIVGCGIDGASVNISDQNEICGKLQAGCIVPVVSSMTLMICS